MRDTTQKRTTFESYGSWKSAAARRLLAAAGNPPGIEDAVQIIANRILDGITCPPTDLDAIKSTLNISGFYSEDLPVSGELRRNGNGFMVVYASHLSQTRQRFTIAHEMGHAFFEMTGSNCPRSGIELERLCDMLATEILMPRDVFLKWLGKETSMSKVVELARRFGTSLAATAIRCAELKRVSVFQVENKTVIWGYGAIKAGDFRGMSDTLGKSLNNALNKNSGNSVVNLSTTSWSGEWKLEWVRFGKGTRTLFLLQPMSL